MIPIILSILLIPYSVTLLLTRNTDRKDFYAEIEKDNRSFLYKWKCTTDDHIKILLISIAATVILGQIEHFFANSLSIAILLYNLYKAYKIDTICKAEVLTSVKTLEVKDEL